MSLILYEDRPHALFSFDTVHFLEHAKQRTQDTAEESESRFEKEEKSIISVITASLARLNTDFDVFFFYVCVRACVFHIGSKGDDVMQEG